MTHFTDSRGSRALQVAQRVVAEQTYRDVISLLRDQPCVSIALSCCGLVFWSPDVDVAVRLMLLITDGGRIPEELSIPDATRNWATPQQIESGRRALQHCIAVLNGSGHPFTLLGHVYGQETIEYHFVPDGQRSAFATIADAAAEEVKTFGRGQFKAIGNQSVQPCAASDTAC